ncbi:MAG TPA: type II toxin-antitoxin system Phd/YefM family antitoxin [Candidatus Binatia bacterium]|nr:type II toxin-antitoxin system Phd/YefM family antitoxin [Candidatus Binatia bacterium]
MPNRTVRNPTNELRPWNLHDAKARLSELVDRCLAGEPQVILRRGQPAVVVLPFSEYERRTGPRESLLSFFQRSPLGDAGLKIERAKDSIQTLRDVEL